MIINNYYLVTRNARDKVQVVIASLSQEGTTFLINRTTGQYQGKMTSQPELIIEKGKAKRSVMQQAELEFNSIIKKYLDKGYKDISTLTKEKFEDIAPATMNELVGVLKTDQNGNLKPQLAKSSNDCSINVFQKKLLCSRKIDGLRMMLKYDKANDTILSVSRGGGDYDIATAHIRTNKTLLEIFQTYPDLILDGELYHHGWTLQKISGTGRLKTWEERCNKLDYWIYDICDAEKTFEERLEFLEELEDLLIDEEQIKVLEHVELQGWEAIKRQHDKWVAEGFEGLVARKPDKKYQFGKRPSDWIKVKEYMEDTFPIVGYSNKLRAEDFTFVLKTKTGLEFDAKPIGTREDKEEYMNDIDNIIGKLGEVKFFSYSEKGIPTQPTFRAVRYDL